MVGYEQQLKNVKNATNEELKKKVFITDLDDENYIKSLGFTKETTKKLLKIVRNRSFFERLLIDALTD